MTSGAMLPAATDHADAELVGVANFEAGVECVGRGSREPSPESRNRRREPHLGDGEKPESLQAIAIDNVIVTGGRGCF